MNDEGGFILPRAYVRLVEWVNTRGSPYLALFGVTPSPFPGLPSNYGGRRKRPRPTRKRGLRE